MSEYLEQSAVMAHFSSEKLDRVKPGQATGSSRIKDREQNTVLFLYTQLASLNVINTDFELK